MQRIILFGILVEIATWNTERLRLLLPQLSLFFKNWVASVPIPSCEFSALLWSVGCVVENAFEFDFKALQLLELFVNVPSVSSVCGEVSSVLLNVVTNIADLLDERREVWYILENLINCLIIAGDYKNVEILQTIDFIFNNQAINKFIPNDFTSTLCLLINNIYLHNEETRASGQQGSDRIDSSCGRDGERGVQLLHLHHQLLLRDQQQHLEGVRAPHGAGRLR